MKPGLSSQITLRDHPFHLLCYFTIFLLFFHTNLGTYTLKQDPPANSLAMELIGKYSLLTLKK